MTKAEFPIPSNQMDNFQAHFFAGVAGTIKQMRQEGHDVICLDEGSPDLPPPPGVVDALTRAASDPGRHRYQPHRGSESLRQAWASMYQRLYGINLDPGKEILPLLVSKREFFTSRLRSSIRRCSTGARPGVYHLYTRYSRCRWKYS